ncbi:hypothetical protein HYS47_00610, partial [Candidatus Woesearchaeota archaeon]|nr:hypothetical protein [Candidatus Woesearchaeota archaeon]
RRQFSGGTGAADFLNELLTKSNGTRLRYKKKDQCFVEETVHHPPKIIPNIPVIDLLRLGRHYTPPEVSFPAKGVLLDTVQLDNDGEDSKHKTGLLLGAYFVSDPLSAVFDSRFETTKVCTNNKSEHSLAGYQDAADPLTHRLRVFGKRIKDAKDEAIKKIIIENPNQFADDISYSVLEACLIESDDGSILVEGVYGSVLYAEMPAFFDWMYACLVKFAEEQGKKLHFNLSFNPDSQQAPIEFANYVAQRNAGKTIYTYDAERGKYVQTPEAALLFKQSSKRLRAVALNDKQAKTARKQLVRNLEGIVHDPDGLLDEFSRERRYADSWQPYEFEVRRNKDMPQWNLREGEVYCLTLSKKDIEREYQSYFGKSQIRKILFGLGMAIAAVCYGYYYFTNLPIHCYNSIVKDLEIVCQEDGQQRHFPIEDLEDTEIQRGSSFRGTSIGVSSLGGHPTLAMHQDWINATADGKKYVLFFPDDDEVKKIERGIAVREGYEALISKIKKNWRSEKNSGGFFYSYEEGKPQFSPPLASKYLIDHAHQILISVLISMQDLSIAMRTHSIIERYGSSQSLVPILNMIDEEAYQTQDKETIMRIAAAFHSDRIAKVVTATEKRGGDYYSSFVSHMLARKNSKIYDMAIRLAEVYSVDDENYDRFEEDHIFDRGRALNYMVDAMPILTDKSVLATLSFLESIGKHPSVTELSITLYRVAVNRGWALEDSPDLQRLYNQNLGTFASTYLARYNRIPIYDTALLTLMEYQEMPYLVMISQGMLKALESEREGTLGRFLELLGQECVRERLNQLWASEPYKFREDSAPRKYIGELVSISQTDPRFEFPWHHDHTQLVLSVICPQDH